MHTAPRVFCSLILILVSTLLTLLILEVACRIARSGVAGLDDWENLAARRMLSDDSTGCAYRHDHTLGWALPPNCRSPGYNIDAAGFRAPPGQVPAERPVVLAAGSSFVMGDEVGDDQTWPAYLQALAGQPVVNAGVSGYSLDQTVLYLERLVPRLKPAIVIAGFTPGDVWRGELRVAYSREKPFFEIVDGRLALRNVPIAKPAPGPPPLPFAARQLGWSVLAEEVVERLGIRRGWYYSEVEGGPPGSGDAIACLLMPRLARLSVPVLILAQYGLGHWRADADYQRRGYGSTRAALACAKQSGLAVLDVSEPLASLVNASGTQPLFLTEHHSAKGNRLIAGMVQRELIQHGLLPGP